MARESKHITPEIGLHISQNLLKEKTDGWEWEKREKELGEENSTWSQMPFLWDDIKSE